MIPIVFVLLLLAAPISDPSGCSAPATGRVDGDCAALTAPERQSTIVAAKEEVLNNDSVIQLLKAGFEEDLIISKIQKSKCNFDTSTQGLIALKQAGVSDRLMRVIIDPTRPVEPKKEAQSSIAALLSSASVQPAAAPRAAEIAPVSKSGDPIADRVPPEIGLYYLKDSDLVKIDQRTLASAKTAGRLGSVATLGIKSVKTNAYVLGPSARTRVKDTSPVFYIRLQEGMSIDEVALVSLYVKNDRRELEVGAKGGIVGGKQGLRMEVMKPFESKELGPRFYKIAAGILGKGEYLFYLIGSADSIKGIQGKGYDFGIE